VFSVSVDNADNITFLIDDVVVQSGTSTTYSWSVSYDDVGNHDVKVIVDDDVIEGDEYTWTVTVNDINRPPTCVQYDSSYYLFEGTFVNLSNMPKPSGSNNKDWDCIDYDGDELVWNIYGSEIADGLNDDPSSSYFLDYNLGGSNNIGYPGSVQVCDIHGACLDVFYYPNMYRIYNVDRAFNITQSDVVGFENQEIIFNVSFYDPDEILTHSDGENRKNIRFIRLLWSDQMCPLILD